MSAAERGVRASEFRPPLIGNRYVVRRRIGRGGTASVYLVFDLRLRAWRAAKVMHLDCAEDDGLRERFSLEAAAMANLEHPNIVRVWDVVCDVEVPYLVMELIEGGTVASWLKKNGPMAPELALDVIDEVLSALVFVHQFGVVHRDVNPRNLLIDRSGTVKLTDFGLARVTPHAVTQLHGDLDRHQTAIGTAMGTEYYMAPEQRRDAASVDARADLFGVGATLFTFLTARLAPDLTVLGSRDPRVRELPPIVAPLIVRACSYQPDDRHADAGEFRAAVARIRKRLPEASRGKLVPSLPPLPPTPPRSLDPSESESLGELMASGAASGVWDGARSEVSVASFRDLPPVRTEPEPRTRVAATFAGALLGLVVAMMVGGVMTGFGARAVSQAQLDALRAEHQFHEALIAQRPIVGNAAVEAYQGFDRAAPDERPAAAEHVFEVLRAVHTGRTTAPDVKEAMIAITAAHNDELRAYRSWADQCGTVHGWVAVALGLASPPPTSH